MLGLLLRTLPVWILTTASAQGLVGETTFPVTVGKSAPALQVGRWLKGDPIAALKPGTTYVVEFWATWCGPCLQAIPHMSELQSRYTADGKPVKFVGISVWEDDQAEVAPFVERLAEQMGYTVGMDLVDEKHSEGASATAWIEGAGQTQLPTAFIVDPQGIVAWIGLPLEVDAPLAQVVAGTWDLEAATRRHQEHMALALARADLGKRLSDLSQAGKWDEAIRAVEASLGKHPDLELELGLHKYTLLARSGNRVAFKAYGKRLVDVVFSDDPGQLSALAWTIADPKSLSTERDMPLARRAAERANELTNWKDPSLVDTLARIAFEQGEVEQALQFETQALALAKGTPLEGELEARLERFRTANESDN